MSDGLRLNVHAGAAVLDGDAAGIRPGLSVAYGNSRFFSTFLTWRRAPLSEGGLDYDLRHIDAGVRTHLRGREAALVPFVLLAYTWRSADYGEIVYLGDLQTVTVHGGGLTFGAGASYYVRRRFALEASVRRSGGAMDRVTAAGLIIRNEESIVRAATYRGAVGLSWWIER